MSEEGTLDRQNDEESHVPYTRSLEELQELRRFPGEPGKFWNAFLRVLVNLVDAASGAIVVRAKAPEKSWRIVAVAPPGLLGGQYSERIVEQVDEVADKCQRQNVVQWRHHGEPIAAVRLETGDSEQSCIAALVMNGSSEISAPEVRRRLLMASDAPGAYQTLRLAAEAKMSVERIARVLDLMVLLNEKKRFLPAAMTFCNELAARLHCERVSLGWHERGCIRLQATSHVDRFDRKSDAVSMLEAAMEEALDQNCEVTWPNDHGEGAVARDHRSFARAHDAGYVCSLPLRIDQIPVGVCTCEREGRSFSEIEMQMLYLFCDQTVRRLSDIKDWDRWFGARLARKLREGIGKLIGFEHTWLKVLALVITALAALLIFASVPYRVTAPLALKTDDIAVLAAPFAGHIQEVDVRVGDNVEEGAELLALDKTDLLLSQAQIIAEMESYRSQVDKARATNSLADMRIAQAREDQARARYNLVRYHLSESVIRAPFGGVVVEGDLQGRIGLPVNQADTLFKIARVEKLYAVLDVGEQDIRWIFTGQQGEMALASYPQQPSKITVTRIEPAALTKSKGNVFRVDCSFPSGPRSWWRPGMTGVAKLNVGDRSPLWLITHRTVDFLKLKLWW